MTNQNPRTWSADIEVRTASDTITLAASLSEYDLLKDQTLVAVRESVAFLDDGQVSVVLWKRTNARGVERDRTFTVVRDRRGVVRYQ